MSILCCRGDVKHIGSYRSKDLALFYLFNVSRSDAFSMLSLLEQADQIYQRTISAVIFAEKFCKDHQETFLYLFRLYFKLIVPKQVVKYAVAAPLKKEPDADIDEDDLSQVLEQNPDVKAVVTPPEPAAVVITEECMPYHYLMCFLLVLMTLPEGEITTWLYWLCYPAQDKKPDHNTMEDLIGELWPKTEKNKAKVILMKKKAQNLLIITDVDDLGANKLRLFDANTGGSWTRPIRNMRQEIRSKTLGYFFWRRLSATVGPECANIDNAYTRLQEPYKLSRWGKKNTALTGERKAARKEVRVFVRLHLSYLHMLNDTLDGGTGSERSSRRGSSYKSSDNGEEEKITTMQYLYLKMSAPFKRLNKRMRKMVATSAQVFPMGGSGSLKRNRFSNSGSGKLGATADKNVASKPSSIGWLFGSSLFRGQQKAVLALEDANVNKEEFISLEVKYKDALSLPVEEVYQRVETAQARAARLLAQCEDEIHFTTLDRYGAGSYSSTNDMGVDYEGRVPRNVVVDVSSSSSGSRSRSGSGSSSRSGSGSSQSWEADSRYNQHNQSVENNSIEELQTYQSNDDNNDMDSSVGFGTSIESAKDPPPKLKGIMKKR